MTEEKSQSIEKKVIVFTLNDETYGVPVEQVISIEKPERMTRVPNTDPYIKGVINLRGVIYPVIDLQVKFGIGMSEWTETSRLAIVQIEDIRVALVVDSADDVINIDENEVEPAPEIVGGIRADFIHGVAKVATGLLILLNLDKVLRQDDLEAVKQIEA